MRVFTYFVEPASYTLDLISNVHDKLGIDFAFIYKKTEIKSDINIDNFKFLSKRHIISKIFSILKVWRNYDFIIVNGYNNYVFIILFFANLVSFKKRFLAIESDTKLRIPHNPIKRLIKKVYLFCIFRNRYILGFAGGSKSHKDLFRNYGMSEDRIFLIPMMIDNKKFYTKKVFPKTFTFLYVGRLLDTRNVDVLCKIFLEDFSDKDAKLMIIGGGVNLRKYKKEYCHSKIEFKGKKIGNELIKIYQESSVFVFPSCWEQWGLVINEALASSLPVIVHNEVGSKFDLVLNKNTGYVINDWKELKEKMNELYKDPELCNKFSYNAISFMKNVWNYELYNTNLIDVIRKIENSELS